jgi:hypothetical protein
VDRGSELDAGVRMGHVPGGGRPRPWCAAWRPAEGVPFCEHAISGSAGELTICLCSGYPWARLANVGGNLRDIGGDALTNRQ